ALKHEAPVCKYDVYMTPRVRELLERLHDAGYNDPAHIIHSFAEGIWQKHNGKLREVHQSVVYAKTGLDGVQLIIEIVQSERRIYVWFDNESANVPGKPLEVPGITATTH